jgi:acyl-CoA carboxylase subunit beta
VVAALAPDDATPLATTPAPVGVPDRTGWEQVVASREADRADGGELLSDLLPESVPLEGIDDTVAVRVGRLIGRRVIGVAMSAYRERRVTIGGYQLVIRAARLAARLDIPLVILVDTPGADPLPASEQGGIAALISAASRAVLGCTAPTVAVVHGAGGSGGALAGAVADVVGVTETGWFAALGPEGAAATLRLPVEDVSDLMGITPRELLASGFADALAPSDAAAMGSWLAVRIDALRAADPRGRLAQRRERWRSPLGAAPMRNPPDPPEIG